MISLLYCENEEEQVEAFKEHLPALKGIVSFDSEHGGWIMSWKELQKKWPPGSDFPFDVVVTDMNFAEDEHVPSDERRFHGLDIFRYVKTHWPQVEVVVVTNYFDEIRLADVVGAMSAAGVKRLHAAQWVRRSSKSGDHGWQNLMVAIEQAATWVREQKALRQHAAVEPLFDVLVLSRDPLTLEVKKKTDGAMARLTFDQPKAMLVLRALCEAAPHFLSPSAIAQRVREFLGAGEARRISLEEVAWYLRFNGVDEPPCKCESAGVMACDFDPFLLSEAASKYTDHPCAEMPACPYDLLVWPTNRKAHEGLRRERFAEENVKTHVYQIKNRIGQLLAGRPDAADWREAFVCGRPGTGYAVAANIEDTGER